MHDPDTGVYQAEFDPEQSDPSTVVVLAVAEALGADSSELERLNYCLDPDCLDTLFDPRSDGTPRNGGKVVFPYSGFEVTVSSDGTVVLDPGADEP